jgi:hypothetical protein
MLTDYGWVHEQDNKKIIRSENGDSLIVEEKGLNRYYKIDKSNCEAGIEWWNNNKGYWNLVRAEWDELFAKNQDIALAGKVDEKRLWQRLFELGANYDGESKLNEKQVREEIQDIINAFIKS